VWAELSKEAAIFIANLNWDDNRNLFSFDNANESEFEGGFGDGSSEYLFGEDNIDELEGFMTKGDDLVLTVFRFEREREGISVEFSEFTFRNDDFRG